MPVGCRLSIRIVPVEYGIVCSVGEIASDVRTGVAVCGAYSAGWLPVEYAYSAG